MSKKITILVFGLFMISATSLRAQNADDVLRYSLEYPSYGPVSLVMPGVSRANGFGTFQENPAAAALMKKSYFSFDLSSRFVNETGSYLGNDSDFSDNQTDVGDLGLAYKVPTSRGSLVIGGGYSQTTDFNRAVSGSGFNKNSTITDYYNNTSDDSLFFAAFDTYAVDFATTDSSYNNTKSIFRFFDNPSDYPGIQQDAELKERGKVGEYSAFLATEFVKNLSVGVSLGYLSGSYSYDLKLLESDPNNQYYNADFIDTDGDGQGDTDVDHILNHETVDADISAFSARLGAVYQPNEEFSVGGSFEFPSKLTIQEDYNTVITNTLDNGSQYKDQAPGYVKYKITRPARLNLGATYRDPSGFSVSASGQGVRYSEGRIDYEQLEYTQDEKDINASVRSNLNDVINWRVGVDYQVNKQFTPRLGYAYYPSPQKNVDADRQFISGGFTAQLTYGLLLDFGLQYAFWDDQNTLYQTPSTSETVDEDVAHINMMIGLRMQL